MAAVTADQIRTERDVHLKQYSTAAVATGNTVYVGTLVNQIVSSGRVRSATAATGAAKTVAGIVEECINETGSALSAITGNTAGTVKVRFSYGQTILINLLTAARTYGNVGKNLFVADNNSLTDTTGAGTAAVRVLVGQLLEIGATTSTGWVALRRFSDVDAT